MLSWESKRLPPWHDRNAGHDFVLLWLIANDPHPSWLPQACAGAPGPSPEAPGYGLSAVQPNPSGGNSAGVRAHHCSPALQTDGRPRKKMVTFLWQFRAGPARSLSCSGLINAEAQGRQALLRARSGSLCYSAGAESNRFEKRTSTGGHLC